MLHLTTVEPQTYKLLVQLSKIEIIASTFALAGGTSLSLQIGHRQSIDLDFFSTTSFNVKELEIILSSQPNLEFTFVDSNSRMLFCFINNIKCDFVHEPAKLINPFINIDGVHYFSVPDIAAMKLHTVCGRGKKKDFFDIYSLLKIYEWKTLLDFFVKKYKEDQLYFLWRSITYFEDAESEPEIKGFNTYDESWDVVKKDITEKVKQ